MEDLKTRYKREVRSIADAVITYGHKGNRMIRRFLNTPLALSYFTDVLHMKNFQAIGNAVTQDVFIAMKQLRSEV